MSGLGKITLSTKTDNTDSISFDESVCGMLFDLTYETKPFDDYPVIGHYFGNGQTVLIHNLDEAAKCGLVDNSFLHGIPYYHISKFYKYIGEDAELYVTIAKCSDLDENPDFSILQDIQLATSGKLFQLGIWTEQYLWVYDSDGEIGFSSLLGEIQSQINVLLGTDSNSSNESFPFNVVVTPCTASIRNGEKIDFSINYQNLPEATDLDFSKVSLLFGQEGSEAIHTVQQAIANLTPVGLMGFAMACLHLASAELSIACVGGFDLNKNDDILNPELGFGDNVFRQVNDGTPMTNVNRIRKNILLLKGYIIPVSYAAKEAGVFLGNDQTLSDGSYSTISNNRVINKCRRVIRAAVLPNVNNNMMIDTSTGKLSATSTTIFQSDIIKGLEKNMVNKMNQSQISSKQVTVDTESRLLDKDELVVKCSFVPMGTSDTINFIDSYEYDS